MNRYRLEWGEYIKTPFVKECESCSNEFKSTYIMINLYDAGRWSGRGIKLCRSCFELLKLLEQEFNITYLSTNPEASLRGGFDCSWKTVELVENFAEVKFG